MDDLLTALLTGFAEILAEILGELILESFAAWIARRFGKTFASFPSPNPLLAGIGYLALGLIAGAATLLVFPHPIFHPSSFRGISLIVSPIATGLIMSQVGAALRRRGRQAVQIESFRYGFAFALGVAFIRLMFTHMP